MNQLPGNITDVFERITDAFVALDKNWCYTYMNKKAGEIFNRDPAKMTGKHIWTEFPEGIDQPFYKAYYRAMETQQYIYLEEYYAPYDLWFENHIYPSPEGLSIFFRDITEKKKTEEGLKKNQRFVESIINASPDIIYIYDIEERKNVFSNDGIQTNLGYTSAEIKEMGDQVLPLLMPKEDFDDYIKNIYPRYATLKDKEILTHEFRMKHKTGSWHWLFTKESVFLRKPDGTPKQIFGVTVNITESKKAEEKLQKSEELFSGAFHASPAGIIITRITDGKIIDANEAFLKMFEFSREETIGRTSIELNMLSPDVRTKLIQQQIASGGLINFELLSHSKSGKPVNLLFSSKQLKINDELCHITTLIDITERKKVETALEESNLSLSEAQRIAKTGSWTYYIDDDLKWSDNMYQLYGLPSKITDTTPDFFFELVHADDRKKMQKWMQACLAGETPGEYEFRSILADGSIHYYRGSGEVKCDKENNPVYMRGTVQDITERKKAEKALSESENRLRTILETEPECVKILDRKGELLSMNPAGLAMIEADNEEQVVGHHMTELVNTKYRTAFKRLTAEVFKGNSGTLEFEITGLKGGHRWLETHAVPLKDAEGKIISLLGVTRDISERKKAEEEIKDTNKQLRQLTTHLQKIREEERKRIGREIHDELGQQLTAIKMDMAWIDKNTLAKDSAMKSKLKNSITLLDESNISIRKILNELRTGVLDHQGLVDALEWLGRQFSANTGIAISFNGPEIVIQVEEAVANCIFRVYQEALTNITRYADAKKVTTSLTLEKGNINLMIKDDGKGFDSTRVKNEKSFGILGMRERVASLNGTFELNSSQGKGTKINVNIPINDK